MLLACLLQLQASCMLVAVIPTMDVLFLCTSIIMWLINNAPMLCLHVLVSQPTHCCDHSSTNVLCCKVVHIGSLSWKKLNEPNMLLCSRVAPCIGTSSWKGMGCLLIVYAFLMHLGSICYFCIHIVCRRHNIVPVVLKAATLYSSMLAFACKVPSFAHYKLWRYRACIDHILKMQLPRRLDRA